MLVRLADWCYRHAPPGRRRLDRRPGRRLRPGRRVRRGVPSRTTCSPAPSRRPPRTRCRPQFPQRAGDTVQIVVHSEAGVSSAEVRARVRRRSSPTSPTRRTSWASPAPSPTAAPARSRRTARPRTPTSPSTRPPTSSPPHEAKALVDPILAAGDDTLQVEVGGPVAALSQTAPRRIRGHRPHRGRHHPADHLRLRGRDGPAAAHRAVRPRHRDGARRGAAARRRRPGLGARHRGDGRHRRRHRLRAAHRHPVPQQPRRGTGPATAPP